MRAAVLCLSLLIASAAAAGETRTEEELLTALASSDYQTRRKAVLAVEGRREPALLDRVLAIARSDPHPNIRGYAAEVLASFRDVRVFPLLARMAKEEEVWPRRQAYVALGQLGDPRGKRILLDGLQAGRVARGYAAKGLGLLGDPEGYLPVARLLREHADDPCVAEMAPEALVRIDRPKALAFLRAQFVRLPSNARIPAARVLGRHPEPKTRMLMVRLLESEDRSTRLSALHVLSKSRDKEATLPLLKHLKRRPKDRSPVIEALGKARDRRAVAPLIAALRGEKELLPKMRMIEALGRLGDESAIGVLVPLLDDTTLLAQPETISAIWGFPWNARVQGTAVWAILTIRDGKEPFPLSDLSNFRDGKPPARIAKDVVSIKAWAAGRTGRPGNRRK